MTSHDGQNGGAHQETRVIESTLLGDNMTRPGRRRHRDHVIGRMVSTRVHVLPCLRVCGRPLSRLTRNEPSGLPSTTRTVPFRIRRPGDLVTLTVAVKLTFVTSVHHDVAGLVHHTPAGAPIQARHVVSVIRRCCLRHPTVVQLVLRAPKID